jgi:hypothetical protein
MKFKQYLNEGEPHRSVRHGVFYHGSNSGKISINASGSKHDHPTSVFGIFFQQTK